MTSASAGDSSSSQPSQPPPEGHFKRALGLVDAVAVVDHDGFPTPVPRSVPVYRGAPNARDYVPDNSVIFIDDFKSVAILYLRINSLTAAAQGAC